MSEKQEKQNYFSGAMILVAANVASQFLGLFSKLAILWLIGDEGVGIYNYPYAIYSILLSFSSVGFNVAISKLISEQLSNKDQPAALRIFRRSLKVMVALGLLATLILLGFAWPLAIYVHHDPRAFYAYIALAPAALLNSWQAAYRGFFQGTQNMRPNAISQIVEQVFRIVTMLGFAALLIPYGIAWGAAGAVFGAAAGALASYLFLHRLFIRLMNSPTWIHMEHSGQQEYNTNTMQDTHALDRNILRTALPISFAGIGLPLYLLADSMMIVGRLQQASYTLTEATAAYGAYANNAMSLIALPTILSSSLFVSLVPAISEARVAGDTHSVALQSRSALKMSLLLALPCAAGLYLVAEPLCVVLGMSETTVTAIRALVGAVPFLVVQQVTAGILQGLGLATAPLITMLCGAACKALVTWFCTESMGLHGAALGTALGFALASLGNLAVLYWKAGSVLDLDRALLRPTIATALMTASIKAIMPYTAHWSSSTTLLSQVALGVICYTLGIILTAALTEEDCQFLPGGQRLTKFVLLFSRK